MFRMVNGSQIFHALHLMARDLGENLVHFGDSLRPSLEAQPGASRPPLFVRTATPPAFRPTLHIETVDERAFNYLRNGAAPLRHPPNLNIVVGEAGGILAGLTATLVGLILNPPVGVAIGVHALGFGGLHFGGKGSAPDLRQQMIDRARNALEVGDENFDYARFFSDFDRLHYPEFTRQEQHSFSSRWQAFSEGIPHYRNNEDEIAFASRIYNYTYATTRIAHYHPAFRAMHHILSPEGEANCSARSKFLVSVFNHAGFPRNGQWIVAVQNFHKHVQLVFYNAQRHLVYNPMTGETDPQIRGALFKPSIYLHRFLLQVGVPSPVTDESLLIARSDSGTGVETPIESEITESETEDISLPRSEDRFEGSQEPGITPPPENFTTPRTANPETTFRQRISQFFPRDSSAPSASQSNTNLYQEYLDHPERHPNWLEGNTNAISIALTPADRTQRDARNEMRNGALDAYFRRENWDSRGRRGEFFFRTRGQAEYFRELASRSPEQAREFFQNLNDQAIRRFLSRSEVQRFTEALNAAPDQIVTRLGNLPGSQLSDIPNQFQRMGEHLSSIYDAGENRNLYLPNQVPTHRLPHFRNIVANLLAFRRWAENNPAELVQQIDRSHGASPFALLDLVTSSNHFDAFLTNHTTHSSRIFDQLAQVYLEGARQTPIVDTERAVTETRANTLTNPLYRNIFLVSPDFGEIPTLAIAENFRPREDQPEPLRHIAVREETLHAAIEILYIQQASFGHLWTPRFSQWFQENNTAGAYDSLFRDEYYLEILRSRGINPSAGHRWGITSNPSGAINQSRIPEDLRNIATRISQRSGNNLYIIEVVETRPNMQGLTNLNPRAGSATVGGQTR